MSPYKEVRKGRSPKWRAVVMINGQRVTRAFDKKAPAVEWERSQRIAAQSAPQAPSRTSTGFLGLCGDYLDHAKLHFTDKTYREKVAICREFLAYLGEDRAVSEVGPGLVNSFLLECAEKRSAYAANKRRKNLLALFNWAYSLELTDFNPAARTSQFPHEKKRQYTPPEGDVLKVLAVATGVDRVFLETFLHTGARRGEVFGLTWGDVNFEKGQICLKTRKTRGGNTREDWLPLTATLAESLRWWWDNTPFSRGADEPVFRSLAHKSNHYGEPFKTRPRWLDGLCARAGVPAFKFHALRRYVASVLADSGKASTKRIQELLRHSRVSTTERYIHNLGQGLQETVNLLEQTRTGDTHKKEGATG